jgi:hypothetical protein
VAAVVVDGGEGVTVDEIAGVAIAVAVVGDSRRQRQKHLGYAAGRRRRVLVVGVNSVLPCDFEVVELDKQRRCFWEEGHM